MISLLIIGGPGGFVLLIVFIISYLWDRKRGWLFGIIIVILIALIASQCEEQGVSEKITDIDEPVSEAQLRETMEYFDKQIDSISSLPSYILADHVLDSLGYRIHPTMTFMEFDNRSITGGRLIIIGNLRDNDSIDRHFQMEFAGNPPVYQSLQITDLQQRQIIFSDKI